MSDDLDRELEKIQGQLNTVSNCTIHFLLQRINVNQEEQINRILTTITLDPYSILSLRHSATEEQIKKRYRALSRQIHPDKTKLPDASKAFDLLKKAESTLMDPKKRTELDDVYGEAELQAAQQNVEVDTIYKELLIKDEFKRRMDIKKEMERQGAMEKNTEERIRIAKQNKEQGDKWEGERDERVNNWRKYQGKVEKKKKKKSKPKVLA